jgi:hypothetical protein
MPFYEIALGKAIPCYDNIIFTLSKFPFPFIETALTDYIIRLEMGHLLEIHLLEKTAQHQNLDCPTPFEQMNKYMKLLESTFSNGLTRFEQMSIILLSA